MALLLEDNLDAGAKSDPISVVPNTLVTVNASTPVAVGFLNGSKGYLHLCNVGGDGQPPSSSFIAPSDTIRVTSLGKASRISVYGDEP